jgi:hypothetical protein
MKSFWVRFVFFHSTLTINETKLADLTGSSVRKDLRQVARNELPLPFGIVYVVPQ